MRPVRCPAAWRRAACVAVAWAAAFGGCAGTATAQETAQETAADSAARRAALQRAQRLVNDGNGVAGRAVVDSLLNRTEPRAREEAEILFWRAMLAESWDQAQRDYLRVMLEHERSPFAAQAMLRLAQGEMMRGDRDGALRYLDRLAREAPASAVRGEAALWQARLLLERGARTEGCEALRAGQPHVRSGALELERQYDFLLRDCEAAIAAGPPPQAPSRPVTADQPAVAAGTQAQPPTPTPTPAPTPSGGLVWSVQIAAFQTAREAQEFAAAIRARGYDVRVDGSSAPFRVRFGRYPTRAAAATAMEEYRRKERGDAFLTQVPRG